MKEFSDLIRLAKIIRKKCPWDREQTIYSRRKEIKSEAREVVKAIDKRDYNNLEEELGDLIWDSLMTAIIAEEKKLFRVKDVLKRIKKKMINRHPHVFGDVKASNTKEALKHYYNAKKKEKC